MQSFAHDASWQLISGLSATVAQSKADFLCNRNFQFSMVEAVVEAQGIARLVA